MSLELTPRQRATVAAALTVLSAAVIIAAVLFLVAVFGRFLRAFSDVFLPIAVAAIVALVLKPYYALLARRLPRVLALALVFLSVLAPLVAFSWFFGALAFQQIADLLRRLPDLTDRVVQMVSERMPQIREFLNENPVGRQIREAILGQKDALVAGAQTLGGKAFGAGVFVLRALKTVLGWAVFPVYLAFFLMADPGKLGGAEAQLTFLKDETRKDVVYLVREFVNIIVAFFRGQLLITFFQALLFATGFSIVGLKYGLVLGLALGMMNVVPYLGNIIGLSVAIPLAYFHPEGGTGTLVGVLVVFALVQVTEAYVLTPRIMGKRTGLHPLAIIISIFFWGAALQGLLGMILAIPLTAFLVVFWRLLREKYIGEIV